jgi:TPP-dependent pyruvate/acetoin dehydrogenase alpha subunit
MLSDSLVTEAELQAIDNEMKARVNDAVKFADESPYPLPEGALEDLWVAVKGGR